MTDPNSIIIDMIYPPLVSGTVASAPVSGTLGNSIRPFATTNVTDSNFAYSAKDAPTIKITDGGVLTDGDGLLTGPGLSKTPNAVGTFTLSNPDYAYSIDNELRNLVFTPSAVTAGQTRTAAFGLDVTDAKAGLTTTDTTTSVLQFGLAVTPIIAAALGGQTVAAGSAIKPLASVSISDGNSALQDAVTISLLTASGLASDTNGTLSGTGLTETAVGKRGLHPCSR